MTKSNVIQLPQSTDRVYNAEQVVLGSILLDAKFAMPLVEPLLTVGDFINPNHKLIYQAMLDISKSINPIDFVTVNDALLKSGNLDQVGGPGVVAELTMQIGSAANVEYFAKLIRDDSCRRQYVVKSKQFVLEAENNKSTFAELLEKHEQLFYKTSREYFQSGQVFRSAGDIAKDKLNAIEEVMAGNIQVKGIKTGFYDIDKFTNGFHPGELIFIAARPGVGKTDLAINLCLNCNVPVGLFSLEMTEEELINRMMSNLSGIDSYYLKTMQINASQWELLAKATLKLDELPIFIDDKAALSLQELRSKARQLKSKQQIAILIIDYLQIMKVAKGRSRNEEIAEISAGLKSCAKELQIPIICLSQLNREIEKRTIKKPQLSDLRESGSIEQDADQVIFLWNDNPSEAVPIVDFHVAKNRNGRTGQGKLYFDMKIHKFFDCEIA